MNDDPVRCYGCGQMVDPIEDDGERYCPRLSCGSTDLEGARDASTAE